MALQLTTNYKGITLTDAYHRIARVSGGKDTGIEVIMGIHTAAGEEILYSTSEYIPADQLVHGAAVGDYLAQAYSYLKTRVATGDQIDYTVATDV